MVRFRRYTNLAATIHLLQNRVITLLNPETWDDKNDSHFMAEYKNRMTAKTVLALCFAEREETYHHWRVFSNGSDGVCIVFDKHRLLSTFENAPLIRAGYVQYKTLAQMRDLKMKSEKLPFLKRHPYGDEREYRIVYVDTGETLNYKDYPIEIAWIDRVVLSPWMPQALISSVKQTLRSIERCSRLKVTRSTLIDNETWKSFAGGLS